MTDTFSREKRSWVMARIKGVGTQPELMMHDILRRRRFSFSTHRRDLPGNPDFVLARYKAALFVHGCFWHGHSCKDGRRPGSNTDYWDAKLDRNKRRDRRVSRKLRAMGWKRIVVWQCQLDTPDRVMDRVTRLLRTSN